MKRIVLGALAAALAASAFADGHEGKHRARAPLLPQYAQECGSCHVPYAPRLLPAASWRDLVARLERHFGTDASLDAATAKAIGAWLEANAASGKRAASAPPENRITRSAWFLHEHDEIAPATWRRPAIKSASNCAACHAGAEQGVFDEHDIRIPR
ncbi:MAG TPA: diheme cytochrome c [Usitatibacter sp.]|nr:diheme cytochrome c [Usitatibacter sp.]